MAKIFAAETRKLFSSKTVVALVAALLACNAFLLLRETALNNPVIPPAAYRTLGTQWAEHTPEENRALLAKTQTTVEALRAIDTAYQSAAIGNPYALEEVQGKYGEDYTHYETVYKSGNYLQYTGNLQSEWAFISEISRELSAVDGYGAFLDEIQKKAQGLAGLSIFASGSQNSYAEKNLQRTAREYAGLEDIEIRYFPQKGLVTALEFQWTDIFAVLLVFVLAFALVGNEKETGLLDYIRSTPRGRTGTALAKVVVMAGGVCVFVALLYGSNLLICQRLFGLGNLGRTIQSVPHLMACTSRGTVAGHIGWFFLAKALALFTLAVWVMLATLWAPGIFSGVLLALSLPGAGLAVRALVPATGRYNFFKYANLASFLRTNEFLGTYRNIYWFGAPVSLLPTVACAAAVFLVLFLCAYLFVFRHSFLRKGGGRFGYWPKLKKRAGIPGGARRSAGIGYYERYKLMCSCGALLLVLLFLGGQVYAAATDTAYLGAEELYYKHYMAKFAGRYNTEKYELILSEYKALYPLQESDRDILPPGFEIQREALRRIMREKVPYIAAHPPAQFVYEIGYHKVFGVLGDVNLQDTIVAAFLCLLTFANFFALENTTGMARAIQVTPLGRRATVKAKFTVMLAVCLLYTALQLLPRYLTAATQYGLPGLLAPANSLPLFAQISWVPIAGMLVAAFLARFVAMAAMSAFVLLVSCKSKNYVTVLFVCTAGLCLPPLLALGGIPVLRWLTLYPLFHFPVLLQRADTAAFSLMILLLAPFFLFLVYSQIAARFGDAGRLKNG